MNLIKDLPREARPGELVALDIEMYQQEEGKLHRPTGHFACISVAFEDGDTYQVYDNHDLFSVLDRIKEGRWIFQNARYDIFHLRRYVPIAQRPVWDTMLMEQGLFGGYYSSFGLSDLSLRWLGEPMEKEVRSEFSTAVEMTPEMQLYAVRDAWATVRIARKQMTYIQEEQIPINHYWEADEPTIWATLDFIPSTIDKEVWMQVPTQCKAKADELSQAFPFNPRSPKQVKSYLDNLLGIELESTNAAVLESMIESEKFQKKNPKAFELIKNIVQFRSMDKYATTYGAGWIEKYTEGNEVWSSWSVVGAGTGRMASRDPNLQNIPAREFPQYRNAFISHSPDFLVSVSDVSQQEPRILAYVSKDETLSSIVNSGVSSHVGVGMVIFNDPDFSKKDPRYAVAKSINLGLTYGMAAKGLAEQLSISVDEAQNYIDMYFSKFPMIKIYMDNYRRMADSLGYVTTPIGRRYYINPYSYHSDNNAINAPIQGGAADQTKIALAQYHYECKRMGMYYGVNRVVHDEINCDIPRQERERYEELMRECWITAGERTIPGIRMEVEIESGENWGVKI